MKDTFAIVNADQGAPELRELIEVRSTAALPVGGRFRVVDFVLSNIAHSGIRSVGLITQRNYKSLMDHIGSGKDWDLSRRQGGLMVLPPYDIGSATGIYRGFCDALFAKRDFIDHQRQKYCLLLDADVAYREDYTVLMDALIESGADMAFLYSRDAKLAADESKGAARLKVDDSGLVTDMELDPYAASSDCIALGAVLVERDLLVRMVEDACAEGRYDFNRDVLLPAVKGMKVVGVEHTGYVGRFDSVKSYFDVNMDMASDADVRADLFRTNPPLYTKVMDAAPVRFAAGCDVRGSIFGNGCDVRGSVRDSVVFRGVSIEEGADVEHCVVMQNTRLGKGCHLRNVIIDKDVVIGDGARIVATPDNPVVIRKGSVVEGNPRVR